MGRLKSSSKTLALILHHYSGAGVNWAISVWDPGTVFTLLLCSAAAGERASGAGDSAGGAGGGESGALKPWHCYCPYSEWCWSPAPRGVDFVDIDAGNQTDRSIR